MAFTAATNQSFSVKAYVGDEKTLLAFNFLSKDDAKNLAGFTIFCQPPGQLPGYYLANQLRFEDPTKHSQVAGEPPASSANAPIQKFRWTHYPGTAHQGVSPAFGEYTFTVTPRHFDGNGSMQALNSSLGVSVKVTEGPFKKGSLSLGFTRGYMQSGAYVHNFGKDTPVVPKTKDLAFDTNTQAGTNNGQPVTFAQIYNWMGETAREQVFNVLNRVLNDSSLTLKVFAYDLNEPDVVKILLTLAQQGRVQIILDNSKEHATQPGKPKTPEDQFAALFDQQKKGPSEILRGCFARYSHDKVFVVSRNGGAAIEVLTGSTNFSLTGLYVNANHVLVFEDADVAGHYDAVFDASWKALSGISKWPSKPAANAFSATSLATQPYASQAGFVPKMSITFSPHTVADEQKVLGDIAARIDQEKHSAKGNVIFAVMQIAQSSGAVCVDLGALHATQSVYSYGISDAPSGIFLYAPGQKTGVQVTGKPSQVTLPAPFDQVPSLPGHEIHDKFVVCGLNGNDPVVYCGSSNLAAGGEEQNGDNLLAIHDADVATAFAIEALGLVDHYNFLDRWAKPKGPKSRSAKSKAGKSKTGKSKTASPKKTSAAKKTPKSAVKKAKPKKAAKSASKRGRH